MSLEKHKTVWLLYDLDDMCNNVWWFTTREKARRFKKTFAEVYQSRVSIPVKFVKPETLECNHVPVLNEVVYDGCR